MHSEVKKNKYNKIKSFFLDSTMSRNKTTSFLKIIIFHIGPYFRVDPT